MADTRSGDPDGAAAAVDTGAEAVDQAGARLQPLGELARRHLPDPVTPETAQAAYFQLARVRARRRALRPSLWAPILGVAAMAGVLVALRLSQPAPLAVTVAGGEVEAGGYLRAPADSDPSLRFSDGTVVELEHAGRLRIAGTTARGARLLLDEGRARASVVPRQGAEWLFDAGPCRVLVTGTRFEMRWAPREQTLDVWLHGGSVIVEGPPARGGVGMHAGQHLAMDLRAGTVRLDALPPAAAGAPEGAAAGAPAPHASERPPAAQAPGAEAQRAPGAARDGAQRAADGWPARVAAGDFGGVIGEAERRGIERVLGRAPVGDVMALGDAARYAARPGLARRALRAVRARFPASPPAQRAAFLLGRMAEDGDGDLRAALGWYATYLDDGPDDVYRAEALGRQMAATLRVHGVARARPLATAYLRQYPRGAYAEAARALLAP